MRVFVLALLLASSVETATAGEALDALGRREAVSLEAEWFVEAAEAISAVAEGRALLVDVRREMHGVVPGAFRIGLDELTGRGGIGKGPLLLMHEGYGLQRLVAGCKRLRSRGRQAAIVKGGLSGWRAAGGLVSWDGADERAASIIPPLSLYADRNVREVVVVELADGPGCVPGALVLPTQSGVNSLASVIEELANRPATAYVAAAVDDGVAHAVSRRLTATKAPVFWVEGGSSGYGRWLGRIVASWEGRTRSRVRLGCPTCN